MIRLYPLLQVTKLLALTHMLGLILWTSWLVFYCDRFQLGAVYKMVAYAGEPYNSVDTIIGGT